MEIGIVGLPNVGKSTLFQVLTRQNVLIANYPFATIDPNVGVVPVPDERIDKLAELSRSAKKIPAVVEFYDIAGLVKGAHEGEGLGNKFLANIRDCQAIVVVLRVFKDSDIVHVEGTVDPVRDLETINLELALKDIETVDRRMGGLAKESKAAGKSATAGLELLKQIREELAKGKLLTAHASEPLVKEMQLLTSKKRLYLLNGEVEEVPEELIKKIRELDADYATMNVALADELNELIRKAYHILGLISFFTTGEDETRAWTIEQGTKAPQAAGVIHTDFEHKFIRAEVVRWDELLAVGGWAKAREHGKLRLEGKEYVVQDGDVMEIRHG
ncbi:MAG: redox-regulated ATPase YchF [Candidatus Liptonbacteria bacterium]|nr:redox-regulated ATPase YchF [Candidatus Liptonbacteria bacterium]